MDNSRISEIITETFSEDEEVLAVAMYALSTLTINEAIVRSIGSDDGEVMAMIPPEAYILTKRFDNGLIHNQFWQDNYVAIKTLLALDDIKLNTMAAYMLYYQKNKDDNTLRQTRNIILSRYDVMTAIAMFYKGVTFAERFDAQFRRELRLSEEHVEAFKRKGIGE